MRSSFAAGLTQATSKVFAAKRSGREQLPWDWPAPRTCCDTGSDDDGDDDDDDV